VANKTGLKNGRRRRDEHRKNHGTKRPWGQVVRDPGKVEESRAPTGPLRGLKTEETEHTGAGVLGLGEAHGDQLENYKDPGGRTSAWRRK